jgi:uncharacterized glyoxalase superfamily protein PhnB
LRARPGYLRSRGFDTAWSVGGMTTIDPMDNEVVDVIPLLVCGDIEAEHDYLVRVLGFTSAALERAPDGTAVHGEVRIGRHRLWLHPVDQTDDLLPPARRGSTGGVVIQVADVDRHHESARDAGATILFAPRDQEYGQREYGVRDPEGHLWWIATATGGSAAR